MQRSRKGVSWDVANIQALRIRGFESHVDTHIQLGPGLNVITGPSDSGKTAIIRALRWLALGEPSGEAYVNQTVGEAEVTAELDDGVTVSKLRRKGKTSYSISTVPEPFEKAEVPEEVKQALGIKKSKFGEFEPALNFAFQLDAPFLISETESAGAKILGKLAGTEVVDMAIKSVAKETHAARKLHSLAVKEIERSSGDLLQYADLDSQKERLDACEVMVEKIDQMNERLKKLKDLAHRYDLGMQHLTQHNMRLQELDSVPVVENALHELEKAQQRLERLQGLYGKWVQATGTVDQLTRELVNYEGLTLAETYVANLAAVGTRLDTLSILSTDYTDYAQRVQRSVVILEATQNVGQLEDLLASIQTAEDRRDKLNEMWTKMNTVTGTVRMWEDRLEQYQGLSEADALLAAMPAKAERLDKLLRLYAEYQTAEKAVVAYDDEVQDAGLMMQHHEHQLEQAWQEAGGVCPLCEQPLQGGHNHDGR